MTAKTSDRAKVIQGSKENILKKRLHFWYFLAQGVYQACSTRGVPSLQHKGCTKLNVQWCNLLYFSWRCLFQDGSQNSHRRIQKEYNYGYIPFVYIIKSHVRLNDFRIILNSSISSPSSVHIVKARVVSPNAFRRIHNRRIYKDMHFYWAFVEILNKVFFKYIASPNIDQISCCEHRHRYSAFSWIASLWILIRIPNVYFQVRALCWIKCVFFLEIFTWVLIWLKEEDNGFVNLVTPKVSEKVCWICVLSTCVQFDITETINFAAGFHDCHVAGLKSNSR
jgi:hypothetical protein